MNKYKTFNDYSEEDKKLLTSPKGLKIFTLITQKKCFFCKKKFNKPLTMFDGFNIEFLAHIKQTHGYEPEIFFILLQNAVNKLT